MSTNVAFHAWRGGDELAAGTDDGTAIWGRHLAFDHGTEVISYADPFGSATGPVDYECATWTSPPVTPGFGFDQVIPSWNATTPEHSWLEVDLRVGEGAGAEGWSPWFVLARWAETLDEIHRCSVDGQQTDSATVLTDYVQAAEGTRWDTYQLCVRLLRPVGSATVPTVRLVGAVASDTGRTASSKAAASRESGVELAVPAYSQQPLRGRYPQWDLGGQSWCSPAATTMALHAWGLGPRRDEYAWVAPDVANPFIVSAARDVYDHAYGGCGNWSFNTAYAARFGATAFVTKLRSLDEAELFIDAGVPLVASVAFEEDQLTGAGYSTTGHLLCVVGLTKDGDVICNDPASHGKPSDDAVRVVYDRAELDRAWRPAGGVVYVIHPSDVALPRPPVPGQPNW